MPRRCVFGCQPQYNITHKLPNPNRFPEQYKAWCKIITGDEDSQLNHNMIVCDRHFTVSDHNRNNRLSALAVPTLFIDASNITLNQPTEMPTMEAETAASIVELETSYMSDLRPSSMNSSIANNLIERDHNYAISTSKKRVHKAPANVATAVYDSRAQKKIKNLRREIYRLRKRGHTFKTRLENAESLHNKSVFLNIVKKMPIPAKIFTGMQLKFSNKKPKGRRFSLEEQILSLSLYKKSPKCYRFMANMFVLPSPKTLKNLLSQVKLRPGINKVVFQKLKNTVAKIKVEDRLCSLIFDEMSICPQIHYDSSKDELKGLVSHSTKHIANHALVFMVKGLRKKFKQPVAYYFTNNLSKIELKCLIKTVLTEVMSTGLIVICTVCDQSTINVSAIKELVNDAKIDSIKKGYELYYDYFICNSRKIIPLYDTPHLLKGLRNNLLNKDLKYLDPNDNKEKLIKWDYFQMLYTADKSSGELRCLPKLTEEHVVPEKIKKMRVKTAAQVFSHSVAVATLTLLRAGSLPEECRALIPFVSLIDNLFDSLNVSSLSKEDGKCYKWPVRKNSDHHELWQKSIEMLKTVKFVTVKTNNEKIRLIDSIVPSVKNFIKTIEGFQAIWDILSKKYNFDCMLTRHFNQDPIENFFGNIRSYGARNNAPNCLAFEGAYKSLLLNNYNSPQSLHANCESDNNDCLNNLDFFFKDKKLACDSPSEKFLEEIKIQSDILIPQKDYSDHGQRSYVCGWVLRKCLQKICRSCKTCTNELIGNEDNKENSLLRAKEYIGNKKWLCYPSTALNQCFEELQNICVSHLKSNVSTHGNKNTIKMLSDIFVTFPFKCEIHKDVLRNYFQDISINLIIYSWCRSINRILSGKLTYDGDDELKIIAQKYYNKNNKRHK